MRRKSQPSESGYNDTEVDVSKGPQATLTELMLQMEERMERREPMLDPVSAGSVHVVPGSDGNVNIHTNKLRELSRLRNDSYSPPLYQSFSGPLKSMKKSYVRLTRSKALNSIKKSEMHVPHDLNFFLIILAAAP